VPVIFHGDGAFAGQGVVAETLNMADLDGYTVGGTIHVVLNNMIGFTATPPHLHSSRYATDVAKRLPIPIFHVNGEDPEAVLRVARLAAEFRTEFRTDVVIDLIGYRRWGHSEVDDPKLTSPLLYRKIEALPPLWRAYASRIGWSEERTARYESELVRLYDEAQEKARTLSARPALFALPAYWSGYTGGRYYDSYEVDTAVETARLSEVAERIASVPEGFQVHPKVRKLLEQRRKMGAGNLPVDWAMAEALAFGSLLWDGVCVRLSGEDSRRGTFNQRHAVVIDVETADEHISLRHLHDDQGAFGCYDSPLSEFAVLGFEYGFSRDHPEALVLWEAQFGDFVNGGQVILDQFLSAGEDKWGLLSGLVVLLPHGYEGQGPEHSSSRPERFLQLAAEDNIQVCQPTTAAQYFHLLRRQMLRKWRKPLIVFTPKSMLREKGALSSLEEIGSGRFHTVIGDARGRELAGESAAGRGVTDSAGVRGVSMGDAEAGDVSEGDVEVRDVSEVDAGARDASEGGASVCDRVLVCTGKVVHELRAERERRGHARTAIVALEQLYPFPEAELRAELHRYPETATVVWVQEEPGNMGALGFVMPRLQRLAGKRRVSAVRRAASASPATGSKKASDIEQAAVISRAFGVRTHGE
jgi:2-oxoglutarate dehydrogenase E1 component